LELQREAEERTGFILRFAQGIERAREDAAMAGARKCVLNDVATYEPEP